MYIHAISKYLGLYFRGLTYCFDLEGVIVVHFQRVMGFRRIGLVFILQMGYEN